MCWRRKRPCSTTCWSTNTRTPTAANTASCATWPRRHRNLCVVGDDDQSIYGWRGAEVAHILQFTRDWPEATVVRLEMNYRSTAAILEHANRLIVFNKVRHDKTLRADRPGGEKPRILQCKDETEEAKTVVDDIRRQLRQPGIDAGDIAVLFRTNEQPRSFEAELRRQKVPYVLIGGTSFFDRKETRDILAYVRLLVMPRDEASLLRIINTPPRGIGTKTVETLMQQAVQQGCCVWDIACRPTSPDGLPEKASSAVRQLVELVKRFQRQAAARTGSLADLVRHLIEAIGYQAELQRQYDDPTERQTRWESVQDVVNALADYEAKSQAPALGEFLDDVALAGREFDNDKEDQLRRNSVALMTLHCAKGLEFPHVYMVGMEEGVLPHRRSVDEEGTAIDEERRLCYVGITRAQERLTFSLALTRRKWGKPRDTMPSRFLYELTGQAERSPHHRPQRPHGVPRSDAPPTASRPRSPRKPSAGTAEQCYAPVFLGCVSSLRWERLCPSPSPNRHFRNFLRKLNYAASLSVLGSRDCAVRCVRGPVRRASST